MPTPTPMPLTAMTTGFAYVRSWSRKLLAAGEVLSRARRDSLQLLRSAPALNASDPGTRQYDRAKSSRSAASRNTASSPAYTWRSIALRFPGRSIVTIRTPSSSSMRTLTAGTVPTVDPVASRTMSKAEPVRLGRPSSFERDELVAVALELGPDNLALRNVAEALGVPRTTVYNHVRSPDELGQLVLSSILNDHRAARCAVQRRAVGVAARSVRVAASRNPVGCRAVGALLRPQRPHTRESPSRRPHYRGADHRGLLGGGRRPRFILVLSLVEESVRVEGGRMHGGHDDNGFLRQLSDDEFPWIRRRGSSSGPNTRIGSSATTSASRSPASPRRWTGRDGKPDSTMTRRRCRLPDAVRKPER